MSDKSKYFRMAVFAEDDDLAICCPAFLKFLFDAFLQVEHHGAGGIDDVNAVCAGLSVGGGRFAVGAQQHFGMVELGESVMVDGGQPEAFQAVAFLAIVYDVA